MTKSEPMQTTPRVGWLNTAAAAAYSGMSVHTIRNAAEEGRLSGCKPGRLWLFRTEDIDAWIETFRVRVRAAS